MHTSLMILSKGLLLHMHASLMLHQLLLMIELLLSPRPSLLRDQC